MCVHACVHERVPVCVCVCARVWVGACVCVRACVCVPPSRRGLVGPASRGIRVSGPLQTYRVPLLSQVCRPAFKRMRKRAISLCI